MNLADLVADAKRRAKLKPKAKRKVTSDDYTRTKEELRKFRLEECIPESIHLRIIRQTCICGTKLTAINTGPLVKKVSRSLTHFEYHEDISKFNGLPRYVEILHINVPYCENCFTEMLDDDAIYVEVPSAETESKPEV